MDYDRIAKELLLALRGGRPQVAWSRQLGYRSNVAHAWESGSRWPTAAETLRAARVSGVDLAAALARFYGNPPSWLHELDPATPEAVGRLIDDLRGQRTLAELATRAGLTRYAVSRWIAAHTQPRLPAFLRVVEAASLRLVDLIAALVDPHDLPTVSPIWHRLEDRRRGAARHPWTQAVLRAIELESYRALPAHRPGWIAERLGISPDQERTCLDFLEDTGQITWTGTHWRQEPIAVDTRRDPGVGRQLKSHWTGVAADRMAAGAPGQFGTLVFTVSASRYERIRELHLAYFHALRTIVAESSHDEVVAVANVQLFGLGDDPVAPAAPPAPGPPEAGLAGDAPDAG